MKSVLSKFVFYFILFPVILLAIKSSADGLDGQIGSGQYELPNDIAVVFNDERWSGCQPFFPARYVVESGYERGTYYPVIMKGKDSNVLCLLKKQDDKWQMDFENEHALFQSDMLPTDMVYFISNSIENYNGSDIQQLFVGYTFEPSVNNAKNVNCYFSLEENEWVLTSVNVDYADPVAAETGGSAYSGASITVSASNLTYRYYGDSANGSVEFSLFYDSRFLMEEFGIELFPLTYSEAAKNEKASHHYELPDDIAIAFDEAQWSGYEPVFPTWYTVESGYKNEAFFPVIMKKGTVNVLCVLNKQDGFWQIAFANETALFSGDVLPENITYYVTPDIEDYWADNMQDFGITYEFGTPENGVLKANYLFGFSDGNWRLRAIQSFYLITNVDAVDGVEYKEISIRPSDDSLIYTVAMYGTANPPTRTVNYNGSFLLGEFDINTISLTFENEGS